MRILKVMIVWVSLLGWVASSAFAQVTQEQALQNAKAFLDSIDTSVQKLDSQQDQTLSDRLPVDEAWVFNWPGGGMRISGSSGKVMSYFDFSLQGAMQQRLEQGAVYSIKTADEAILRAQGLASKMGIPISESKVEEVRLSQSKGTDANGNQVQLFAISMRRYLNGYRTPDFFSVIVEPFEGRIVTLYSNWESPICETVVNLSGSEAIRLALEGLQARGIAATAIQQLASNPMPVCAIVRANYYWTNYVIPFEKASISRLAWIIAVRNNEAPIGYVYIDAATGEWLGGDGLMGRTPKMSTVPPLSDTKAFLMSRLAESKQAHLPILQSNCKIIIKPEGKTRWSALAALLVTLRPQKKYVSGVGEECLALMAENRIYHLKWVKQSLRLEGPDVPGGAMGFEADSTFQEKLVRLSAPLAPSRRK